MKNTWDLPAKFKAKPDSEVALSESGQQGSLKLDVVRWWISPCVLGAFTFSQVLWKVLVPM